MIVEMNSPGGPTHLTPAIRCSRRTHSFAFTVPVSVAFWLSVYSANVPAEQPGKSVYHKERYRGPESIVVL